MRETYRCIARVAKAHGRRGEVVTVPVHGLPSLVREGLRVAVVPPELTGSRWHTVASCSHDDRSGDLVSLLGCASLGEAEALVGRYLLASEKDLPVDLALHDAGRLVGREVAEGDEVLGEISEVMSGPANDVWVVRGARGELLLPVIDAVVREVPEEGAIQVRVPAGLTWEGAGRR
ncbi:ribosome maturation factor RimM [Olsenella profusa]|uniref:Ribosome maturation factor RimM n=1 Tax=Olsenella profusa TaxID=138595 RepID=A0ABS2EZW4_9ACTN|nr:16S rRNA processing protein RimM [Olsenella profusa]MBM6774107.1 16S rRNA processing protein RimM [Olsenella profusa]